MVRDMSNKLLDQLSHLECAASPGPWCVARQDDDHCMGLVAITNHCELVGDFDRNRLDGTQILAATLVQQPPYVVPTDKRWEENAALIVAMRNALPELLRLARIGLAAEAPMSA